MNEVKFTKQSGKKVCWTLYGDMVLSKCDVTSLKDQIIKGLCDKSQFNTKLYQLLSERKEKSKPLPTQKKQKNTKKANTNSRYRFYNPKTEILFKGI